MYSKELNKQKAKEWYYANKTKALKRIKAYRLLPGWIQKREWDLKNKDLINAKNRIFIHNKYISNPHFKLIRIMHNQLLKGLKYHNLTKKNRTFVLLGYSAQDLKIHLEKQFTPEMSWSNYGSYWHIDHKIPKSFAQNKKELIELFQLDNLQPLEAKANVSKYNRVIADLFGSGSWFD